MSNVVEVTPSSNRNIELKSIDDQVPSICVDAEQQLTKQCSVISFHNITYNVEIKNSFCGAFKPIESKQILSNVSGVMKPGMNAIMGPTGSGKSSLLDVLAGRKDRSGLSGDVLINGSPLPPNFKRISGYVVQQDAVLGTLTVRENLWFSASLRLPRSLSIEKKRQRVQEILYDLGLTNCADTKVGTELVRGISGGEKKRACIGMELITAPNVLFLDEPTTGLDASTANAVILLLKRLGNRGRTIILSIHQPRYSIFRLFDSLTLLSRGRLIYHGPYDQVLSYFEGLGYQCQEHNNPADFFLDIINGDSTALANVIDKKDFDANLMEVSNESNVSLAVQLEDKFKQSSVYQTNQEELSKINKEIEYKGKNTNLSTYATPFHYQFFVLMKRAFQNVIRNPLAFIGTIIINIVIAVLFGIFFYQINDTTTIGVQNRFGVLFFMITNMMFGSVNAVEVFSREKPLFVHEYASGYYMVISYFLSKLVADLFFLRTLAPIVFGAITYWLIGLKPDAPAFFTLVLILILIGYTATSIALFYSASFETFAVASIFISLTFVFSIMFAGLLLNVASVFPWLVWIKYLSIANYGYSGLAINEFRNSLFFSCPAENFCLGAPNSTIYIDGNETCCARPGELFIMDSLVIGDGTVLTDWQLWSNVVALVSIFLGMLTLTYIQLMRTKTTT